MLADVFHQLQRRSWRELQVFVLVEPESLASCAYIERKLSPQTPVQRPVRHFRRAIGALHCPYRTKPQPQSKVSDSRKCPIKRGCFFLSSIHTGQTRLVDGTSATVGLW